MISFTNEVKEEIVHNDYNENQKKDILKAFLISTLEINISSQNLSLDIFSSFPFILRFIHNILSEYYKIEKNFFYSEYYFGKIKKYKLSISGDLSSIERDLDIYSDNTIINKKNVREFLIGFFLSMGSVNSPNSSTYHLEFRIKNKKVIEMIKKSFDLINIDFKIIDRKNLTILYIKKSELISDFLKFIGAIDSMFKFEDSRIRKDFTNQVNRLNNLDISNIKKTINFSKEMNNMIEDIYNNKNKIKLLGKNEKIFCDIKIKYPESSLSEISNIFNSEYGINISKSGVNHYARKIKKIYEM